MFGSVLPWFVRSANGRALKLGPSYGPANDLPPSVETSTAALPEPANFFPNFVYST